ncbi:low molecular weight phosphatase family protein [Mycobacterium sp. SMC-4]|uniref:arsenate reductase/protein-tyrosine-phosphatase family protein n=1 Tax=Mycobacterium sp. SMC-4 TaxID=2857059 RepID=UPI003D0600B4
MEVLFVCTGNICRSPTAERLAVAAAARMQIPAFVAHSAGTRAVIGHGIHKEAGRVLERLGGDVGGFTARQLSPKIAGGADLILAMTRAHRDIVLELAPRKINVTFTMREAFRLITERGALSLGDLSEARSQLSAGAWQDVRDPIGESAEVFDAVGEEIFRLLPPILGLVASDSKGT